MKVSFKVTGSMALCLAAVGGCSRDLPIGVTSGSDVGTDAGTCGPEGLVVGPVCTAGQACAVAPVCAVEAGQGTILAGNQTQPDYVAVDRTNLYWTNSSAIDCDGGGSIMKVALDGGVPVVLAPGQDCPVGIAVDDSNVYWTNNVADGSVSMVPITGGPTVVLASGQFYPTGIAVHADEVVWANGEISVGGGVAAMNAGSVMRAPLDGGAPVALVSGLDQPFAVAVDDTSVYFTAGANSIVEKVPLIGGTPVVLASSHYGNTEGAIALDSTSLYTPFSISSSDMGCNPAKIPLDGGPPMPLDSLGTAPCGVAIYSLATDGAFVYWTQEEGPVDGGPVDLDVYGVVKKVSVNGGVPITLASGLSLPRGIAVDDANVYWAGSGDGTVRRAAK